jgi:hypothetical protein
MEVSGLVVGPRWQREELPLLPVPGIEPGHPAHSPVYEVTTDLWDLIFFFHGGPDPGEVI